MVPTPPRPTSKSVCEYFFKQLEKHAWQCKKCMKTKSKNGGWTNLVSHLRSCVGSEYEKAFLEHQKLISSSKAASGFFISISDCEKEMYNWINFIVMKNLPVSFVQCPFTRDISRLKAVSAQTLRGHILSLLSVVKEAIKNELPSKFTLVFDGWTEGTHHYVAVAAAYMKVIDGKDVPTQTMLSLKPLLVEGIKGMCARDHLDHIENVLESYDKAFRNVICLVGDNCAVNQSMARILHVPLLGCASHKFNLAVREWIARQEQLAPIIQKVSRVMKKASTLKVAAQLRELTTYCPVRENDTRWSSTFQMIKRFLQIQNHLGGIVELLALLPNHLEVDYLTRAFESLKKFDSVTVMLQREGMSFVEAREVFDLFLLDHPDFETYISDDAAIVEDKLFEKAVMRIVRSLPLSEEEQVVMAPFQKETSPPEAATGVIVVSSDDNDNIDTHNEESYAETLQRKRKRQQIEVVSVKTKEYIDLNVLPGTSVNCERLFSLAKAVLSDTRKRTSPKLFEALVLLKVNRSFWNAYSVGQAMGRINNDSSSVDDDVDDMLDMESDCNDGV